MPRSGPHLCKTFLEYKTVEMSRTAKEALHGREFGDFIVEKKEVDSTGADLFSLSPRSEQVLFSKIEIKTFKGQLQTIKVVGLSGEVTEINLSNFKKLEREDSIFEISVPEGTDIVEG